MRLGTYYRSKMLDLFKIKANSNCVLDVGGYDGYWLSTQKAKNKYVMDLDIVKQYKRINYVSASALDIPFPKNFFNQVFAFDVLEHIIQGEEQKFLDELIRVCKKKGEIILSIPSDKINIFPPFLTNYVSKKWGHYKCNGYSKKELSSLLSQSKGKSSIIIENNAKYFRMLYLFLWVMWKLSKFLSKKLLNIICKKDSVSSRGDTGYFIVKIIK